MYSLQQSQGAALNFTIAERIKDLFDRQTVSGIIFDACIWPIAGGAISAGAVLPDATYDHV
jgi:hypothetical protein